MKVVDLTNGEHIERELLLIKLMATGAHREELKRLADIFRAQIVDVSATTYTIQLVGNKSKTDAFINALDASLILETVRSGALGIMRGEKRLQI